MSSTRYARFVGIPVQVVCVALIVQVEARAQCQVDKVTASNARTLDRYGWSVAVNGDYAVVGATFGDGGGSSPQADTGAAYLLHREGLNWFEIQKLVANDSGPTDFDEFGASVAISDNAELIVVGALKTIGTNSTTRAGAVYVFKRYQDSFPCRHSDDCTDIGLTGCTEGVCVGLTWVLETKLLADNPAIEDEFGFSVDISGDVVVVGADRTQEGENDDAGAAYVYRRHQDNFPCVTDGDCQTVGLVAPGSCVLEQGLCTGVAWVFEQKLAASNAAANELFGWSVSVEGNRLVVGAKSISGTGGAYVFEYDGTIWNEVQQLTASDGISADSYGQAVDLSGDTIVVTAMGADLDGISNAGKAYVYRPIGGIFADERILTASNGLGTDRFGRSASLHGNKLLIGARDTDVPASRAGSAYIFNFDGTDWNEIEEIRAADGEGNDRFGHVVSLSETYGIIGAYREDDAGLDAGAAYVFAIGLGRDCNDNLVPDDCEVIDETEPDGNANGTPDACECQSDGDCGGSDSCSIAICDQDRLCELAVIAGFCRVDGVCYADGAANPGNSCQVCNTSRDKEAFSAVSGAPSCTNDGSECTLDVCALGICTHQPLIEGLACGDPTNTECNRPDTCDGGGVCVDRKTQAGTPCASASPDDNECTGDACDGAGNCTVNNLPEGTPCTDDGDPCTDDECDGLGACDHLDDDSKVCSGTVEAHQKISATEGGFTGALDSLYFFGRSATLLGDLDGDGVADLAVGAPGDDDGGTNRGAVWVLFLNTDGTIKAYQKISDIFGNLNGTLDNYDSFGAALASLGDLDGDGVCDLAVGAARDDDGGIDRGAVWVLFLNTDGTVKSHQKISETQGGFTGELRVSDGFGGSLAWLGDIDGDGVGDLAVGASGDDGGGENRGAVWVLFLNANGTVKAQQKIGDDLGGFTGVLDSLDLFGRSATSLGDLDGDGVADLAVGVPADDDGGTNRGAVWVLFLNTDGTIKTHQKISDIFGSLNGALDNFDSFGASLASLGDLDGDGVRDLAVGAFGDDDGGFDRGAVWVLFLNTDGTVKSHQKISETHGGFVGVLGDYDGFGGSLASLGDLNGDGVGDLAVGASLDDDGGNNSGAVWILFLEGEPDCIGALDGSPCKAGPVGCTDDVCISEVCEHLPLAAGTLCGDSAESVCDHADTCDGAGNCQFNFIEDGTRCDDSLFCNGIESCVSGVCQSSGDPCGGDLPPMCDEATDICFPCESDEFCDDGLFCTGVEQCIADACQSPGSPCASTSRPNCDEELDSCYFCRQDADCDDSNLCTIDRCEQAFCVHAPAAKGVSCGDSSTSPCDLPDFCDGLGGCLENLAPDGTLCQDQFFCNGKESCVGGDCMPASDPCAGSEFPVCDEASDACLACGADEDCNDELDCTDDVCVLGQCIHPWFAEGMLCGDRPFSLCHQPDTCDGFGSCIVNNIPDGFSCDDRLFCNGEDTCRVGVCVHAGDVCAADGLFCDEFSDSCSATPPPTVIYSNTFGEALWRPRPTGIRVADDIVTNAVNDCSISDVTIRVNGGIPGGGGTFAVRTWMWDGCPNLPNSSIVAGTERVFDGLDDDDAIDHDLQLIPPGGAITLPPTFWIQVSFSTRRSGWVISTPATAGYTGDQYNHPFTWCNTWFGGWPNFPHASGYTVVRAEEPCPTLFPAYRAVSPTAPTYVPPLGPLNRIADDLFLITDVCVLGGYELGIRGMAGPYEMSMDIRVHPEGSPIFGTQFVFEGKGEGSIEVARFTIPPEVEITIPGNVWMTWQASKPSTGVLNVGRTQIGQSQPTFAGDFLFPVGGWIRELIFSDRDAIFYITIYCRGEEPRGACCPAQEPDAATPITCQEDVSAQSCATADPRCGVIMDCPQARWSRDRCCGAACCVGGDNNNQSCADNVDCPDGSCVATGSPPAFDPPCGTHACCQPGEGGKKCEDLFFDECQAITDPTEDSRPCETDRDCPGSRLCEGNGFCEPKRARWSSGEFCGVSRFECPFFPCFDGEGDCLAGSDEIACESDSDCAGFRKCLPPLVPLGPRVCEARRGCADIECCDSMCAAGGAGNFCCAVVWDSVCVNLATSGEVCPDVKPGNDFCFDSSRPSLGAIEIVFNSSGLGFADSNNSRATLDEPFPEPGFCCHNDGVDQKALGTMWYWFEAPDTSAQIDTCQSIGTSDTVLQVFSVDHPDRGRCIDGSICSLAAQDCIDGASCLFDKQDACDTLASNVIGCNDDFGGNCGDVGTLSRICLTGLTPGERYYVLLGSPTGLDVGRFSLRIQTPCTDSPPIENTCEGATFVIGEVGGFDLADTSLDCPAAPCVPSMKNDYWKIYQAPCTGQLTAHTCEGTVEDSPATTMAVYQVPPGNTDPEDYCNDPDREVAFPEGLLVGCNDDADVGNTCTFSGDACDSVSDCRGKRCTLNSSELCLTDVGCQNNCQTVPGTQDQACAITGEDCTTTADCADFGTCAGFAGAEIEGACSISGDACQSDNDCSVGRCANDDFTVCDTTEDTCPFGRCAGHDFNFCSTNQDCINQGLDVDCERWPCVAKETCEEAECVNSTCGRSAYVSAPVFQALFYLIRVGGEFGEEFTGNLTVTCEQMDCNENGGPDPLDIVQGVSTDCNNNLIPDECEILRGSIPGAETFCDVDCLDDCNENIVPDVCETITDCNNNGVGDECELLRGSVAGLATFCDANCMDNCNANGTMDVCEIDASSDAAHCTDGAACTIFFLPCADGSACVGGPGTYFCFGAGCDPDTNNNGIPDECDIDSGCTTLVADFPPNCAIDARQPSDISGPPAQGWTSIDVTVGPSGCALALGDVAVNSVPTGPAPSITGVSQVGDVATITFDSVIPTRNWTCVSLTADPTQAVCIGNLPGDVDGSGVSNPALDLIAMIDCLNSGTCPAWAADTDRDGFIGVLDLTRLIDLFNGAGSFTSWIGADLGSVACPSAP